MPALTTVATHATGDVLPATDWNIGLRDNINYLVNAGASLASAASIVTTNEFHLVTGSTTIDNITPATPIAGQQVRLAFQATCTVRHNGGGTGNIRLCGGLHAGFVANEVLHLAYDGTNWIEITRTANHLSGEGGINYSGPVTTVPLGMLVEDGSAISRTTYAAWFANVGTLHGVGDGSTTVNLPDSRGRFDVGFAPSGGHTDVSTIGANDGVTLANRRPKHRHTISAPAVGHTHTPAETNDIPNSGVATAASRTTGNSTETGGSAATVGTATDALDAPPYLVRPKLTRI